jgi:hypothetical protein
MLFFNDCSGGFGIIHSFDRTRPPAASSSTKKAKEILAVPLNLHPDFAKAVDKLELARESVLKSISQFVY